jgi:hypothetical protein
MTPCILLHMYQVSDELATSFCRLEPTFSKHLVPSSERRRKHSQPKCTYTTVHVVTIHSPGMFITACGRA